MFRNIFSARLLAAVLTFCFGHASRAAVFPVPSASAARLEVTDTQGLLSWNPTGVTPAPNALTVMFWMKITLPDAAGFELNDNMTIAGNSRTGPAGWTQNHAYRFYFNKDTGNIEFTAKGTANTLPAVPLVQRPYLDRWYHLAAVRSGAGWAFYVDGRSVPIAALPDIGNMNSADGVSIGGLGTAQKFFGEVQEFADFSRALERFDINDYRLKDIPPATSGLRGYYKLGYSTVAADNLKNYAAAPAAPLTAVPDAVKQGTGAIEFPETDKQGEQSLFDSQKNQGRDAQSPLSGAFSWQRTLFTRPTPGIPFEFRIGYNSGISYNSQVVENGASMFERDNDMGPGWRHSFQTRIVPGTLFAQDAGQGLLGLLLWDGSLETWTLDEATEKYQTLHGEYRGELTLSGATSMEWITPERLIYRFYHPYNATSRLQGKIREIRDFNGNKVSCDYDVEGRLIKVTDTSRTAITGEWTFTPDPATGRLKTVSSQGWTATFNYTTDAIPKLLNFSHRGPAAYEATTQVSTTWTPAYGGPNGLLSSIATPRGTNDVTVAYDKYGRKTSEADGAGRSTAYKYHTPASRQISRTDGDGKVWIETFDRKGHVIAKADPLGNTLRYEFYKAGDTMTGGGAALVSGVLKKQTEPVGWVTLFDAYDERGNLLQKTDALGRVWKWTFAKSSDPAGANGRLTERLPAGSTAAPVTALLNRPLTDTRPRVTGEAADWTNRYLFDQYGNLTSHTDDLGTLAAYTYDDRGLVLTARDGNGNQSTSAWFPDTGFLKSKTDPYGKTTTFETTELGWVKQTTNAIGQTVTCSFDINGNAVSTTDAAGRTTTATYDEVGNLRFAKDAKGQQSEHQYDGSNLRTWSKDRAGNVSTVAYNLRSLPTQTNSPTVAVSGAGPQSLTTQRTYDDAGRALRETDPAGEFSELTYDANGNTIATRDKLGRVSRRQYDRLNRAVVEIDPLGHTRTTTYDEAGRLLTVTSPNGFTTRHEYDGRGRLKKWTDPEGSVWIYTYDGVGNITDIEDALHGHYKMTYDARNARLTEENQDGLRWGYTYDELARLRTQAEPTGITRTLLYDLAGRLLVVNFSTGRQNILAYDDNDNVLSAIRIESGSALTTFTTFGYDALDRPIRSTDTFSQTVGYGYDALGRTTALTYPGGRVLTQEFDKLSRLVRQSTGPAWGNHTLTYTWDNEGRLTGMTYPNGITRTAAYDESGRQTSLTYTDTKATADPADDTIQIALHYAYDKNGNQTSAREKGLLTYTPPAPHDETTAFTPDGRLQTRTDTADPTGQKNWTYEFKNPDGTPSFNLSKATSHAIGSHSAIGSLELTYDEDNRTTSISTIVAGGTTRLLRNRYDALGRRISRRYTTAFAAVETQYVLSLTGGMERILADTTAAGALTALYIHGPDLAVKVDPANPASITCYHPDASGNIVRLTDKDRAPLAQYAYSDYGRPFAATAAAGLTDINPYRFVGSQGVMEEPLLPGLYFMRARYYLADAGVFLSTDPVKNIGPGWKPEAYRYAAGNPTMFNDPNGEIIPLLLGIGIYYAWEQTYLRAINSGMSTAETIAQAYAGAADEEDVLDFVVEKRFEHVPLLDVGIGVKNVIKGRGWGDLAKAVGGYIPGGQTVLFEMHAGSIAGYTSVGLERDFGKLPSSSFSNFSTNGCTVAGSTPMFSDKFIQQTPGAGLYAQSTSNFTGTPRLNPVPPPSATTSSGGGSFHVVQAGDSLSRIAAQHNVSTQQLISANPQISNPNLIYPNQRVNIPSNGGGSGSSGGGSNGNSGGRPGTPAPNPRGDFPVRNIA